MAESIKDKEELEYLSEVIEAIEGEIKKIEGQMNANREALSEHKRYIWDNIYEMDTIEKAANATIVYEQEESIDRKHNEFLSLNRLKKSPYFGRVDFSYDDDPEEDAERFYIGIRGFAPPDSPENYVYDWRAPVSSMFYDFDEGPAGYDAPKGHFDGILRKKRQYKIVDGKLIFVLNSSLKIDDEILQEALSHTTDNKMKNIVATIQREQNKIIRDLETEILIVQGVAGSGKTSIALHRIAFILYSLRDKIKSNEILVISPNHVFSDYISNVLPELGETNINEMSLDDLVRKELKDICRVENPFNLTERIIETGDEHSIEQKRRDYKESKEFYDKLKKFVLEFPSRYVNYKDVKVNEMEISKEYIQTMFERESIRKRPYFTRFDEIANAFSDKYEIEKGVRFGEQVRREIRNKLKDECLIKSDIIDIYDDFLQLISKDCNIAFEACKKKEVLYEDAFPLVYLKFEMLGFTAFNMIKHVVIDEMQDYSMLQFEILKTVFPCKMTILGDIHQVINKKEVNALDVLSDVFPSADIIEINKTYRSTEEITKFADRIIELKDVVPFSRHGDIPQINKCKNLDDEAEKINELLDEHTKQGLLNVAVICKTEKQAKNLYKRIVGINKESDVTLFTKESKNFNGGKVIITSYLAKGLEFDAVIIPDVDDKNYSTNVDKQILYIAATRALHRLDLLYVKNPSLLIPASSKQEIH